MRAAVMAEIQCVLIANRGEIAGRIARTLRTLGIRSVAVFSDADADAPHLHAADTAVRIGPAPSRDSYLNFERIIAAAAQTGADAVHPGFGFLAENADFAQAVIDAGLIWIGPSPSAIRAMGLKREAKRLVLEAGVPVIPGGDAADQSTKALAAEAENLGFPVLIKASAGGGGKGMRIVRDAGELHSAIDAGKREAMSAFGDETILIEKYIEEPRHVEIQILGDSHGNLVHLFERECSIQRRHQKIVEEAPSPAVTPELREKMGAAALAVGRVVQYTGAGTVEFILAPDKSFYFLEVNTRLQVEHPVTECITGIDLVAEQLRVAEGRPLSMRQEDLSITGAAIEVRLYAEDPAAGFLPTTGQVALYVEPTGVRVDSGIHSGSEIGIHYDPMLAKVVAHGRDRPEAIRKLRGALRELVVLGVVTNREFLHRVLSHPEFASGNTHTHFISQHGDELNAPDKRAPDPALAAVAATLYARQARRAKAQLLPGLTPGYANNRFAAEQVGYRHQGEELTVQYVPRGKQLALWAGEQEFEVVRSELSGAELRFETADGVLRRAHIAKRRDQWFVQLDGCSFQLTELPRFPVEDAGAAPGALVAPMPGKVVRVEVKVGDAVTARQTLVILEAMKMEHRVVASHAGTLTALNVAEGDQVDAETVLAVISEEETNAAAAP